MEALDRLFKLREALHEYETALGINDYSDIERSVLEFIVNQKKTTISNILKHSYFQGYSLSTINRVVSKLLSSRVIRSEQSNKDKREFFLSFCLNS
ncbi:helix-turn-helix domain-containing protein [Candidatus Thioglobus sp.]|jgi:hypothetical protein|uniref:helix-turn-helix domain-containing protein n=1 Tax=Candidatus Thioglobus sp. TaxID=2026721 RepID=UPI00176223D6|nr:MarR family transcriptional regulator [Candidatus Thioglobus sp.]